MKTMNFNLQQDILTFTDISTEWLKVSLIYLHFYRYFDQHFLKTLVVGRACERRIYNTPMIKDVNISLAYKNKRSKYLKIL